MRARWIVLPAVLALVAGELAAPPGPAAGAEPSTDALAASSTTFLAVSAGNQFSCAIRADRTLTCWGEDYEGRATPPVGNFVAVDAGSDHACAIRTDGGLACWGSTYKTNPPAGTFVAVSVGEGHACAIRTDGRIGCWGNNYAGQASPPAGTFSAVSAGGGHTCAIRTDGRLACWGYNYYGEATPPAGTFSAVSAGGSHTCALHADGTLACWGNNYHGQASPPSGTYRAVDRGSSHACAIRTDGTLACWGFNLSGQASPPAGRFTAVSAGEQHTCAIRTDGRLACWGGNMGPQPTATLAALPAWLGTSRVALGWTAKPATAPIASYELRYRRARWDGTFGAWATWLPETTATSATYVASPGYTYCFSVRAWDTFGIASSWSTRCTAVPLDDRSLVRSSSWVAGTGTAYYRHTYLQGTFSGAKLTRTGVKAKQIALLATTCPTCGTVKVYWGSTLLKTVSLSSATTLHKQLIPLASFSSVRTGTLTIRIVGGGKPVIIDGVAIRPT